MNDDGQSRTLRLSVEQCLSLIDAKGSTSILDGSRRVRHPRLAALLERHGFRADQPMQCEWEPASGELGFRQNPVAGPGAQR